MHKRAIRCVILLCIAAAVYYFSIYRLLGLHPGPPPLPLIGNVLSFRWELGKVLLECKARNGRIFTVWLPFPMVVIGDHKVHNYALEIVSRWRNSGGEAVDVAENTTVRGRIVVFTKEFDAKSRLFAELCCLFQEAIGNVVWKVTFGNDFDFDNEIVAKFRMIQQQFPSRMSCVARLNIDFVVDTHFDYAIIIHNSTAGVINVALAILVVYLLLVHSPSSMRIYRWFLIQLVVLSSLQDFMMHVLQPHIILPVLAAYLIVPWPLDAIAVHYCFLAWLILTAHGFCAMLDGFFYRDRCLLVNFYPNSIWQKYWRELTVFWHVGAFLIILIPWPMLDISKDKMRAELERTYPNVIPLMEEKRTFLMYTFGMHPFFFPLAILAACGGFVFILIACAICFVKIFWVLRMHGKNLSEKTKRLHSSFTKQLIVQAFVPLLFKGIPDISMIVSAFCLRDLHSSIFGRITVSIASVHAIINSVLVIVLHKPFRDKVLEWLKPIVRCRSPPKIQTIERSQSSQRHFTSDHGRISQRNHSHYDDLS